ncbi:MAG: hypothetical protein P8104_10105, partial [Gammaproteobacteria bacterium]
KGITRELAFGEFEAMLDGLVDVQAFANSEQRAVYAQVNANLRVVSCVLFRIAFDEKGLPSRDWNLPFDQLIVSAGKGPDLGAGPIKLSTLILQMIRLSKRKTARSFLLLKVHRMVLFKPPCTVTHRT